MSLEEEQLIASSELSLEIYHCFMILVICFSMSYMYFDLGTQTKKRKNQLFVWAENCYSGVA